MQTAIATVSLSGTLDEKLEAIAAAGFKGVEIFENDLLSFNGTPARCARHGRGSRADARSPSSPSAISRACRSRARQGILPGGAQVRPDAGARLRPAAGVQQRLAGGDRRHRPRRGRLPRARRAGRSSAGCASATRRSPGAGTSTIIATHGRWCGAPTIRPSGSCSIPSMPLSAART